MTPIGQRKNEETHKNDWSIVMLKSCGRLSLAPGHSWFCSPGETSSLVHWALWAVQPCLLSSMATCKVDTAECVLLQDQWLCGPVSTGLENQGFWTGWMVTVGCLPQCDSLRNLQVLQSISSVWFHGEDNSQGSHVDSSQLKIDQFGKNGHLNNVESNNPQTWYFSIILGFLSFLLVTLYNFQGRVLHIFH